MKYVEVILPLPLEGVFTYIVPPMLAERLLPGMRVLVPLGRSKHYTGVAVRMHGKAPGFDCKEIESVLDEQPVLLPEQLKLWEWVADYYLSPLGDVYKAALPAGLKAEDGYRPKTETRVRFSPDVCTASAVSQITESLKQTPAQLKLFQSFLSMARQRCSGEDFHAWLPSFSPTREELLNESRSTMGTYRNLVKRKLLQPFEHEVGRLNKGGESHFDQIKSLSEAQQQAYDEILSLHRKKNVVLLHGVTSSGKTEIYIHLIRKAIDEGRQVLYLLPEIALTVQMMARLRKVFGNRLGIYHSKYSDAERVEIWQKQLSDEPYDVILGARSAVFLPFRKLGLVIVDEEHEASFKQQDPAPRYHARSAAIVLAAMYQKAKVVLGTATPSLESFYNAQSGKYGMVTLTTRYQDIRLPEIHVVDMKDRYHRKLTVGAFSNDLLEAVREALSAGEQVILFQNRRGFAPMVTCKDCGWVPKCQNCDVSLTYHKRLNALTCHYCGHTYFVPEKCPSCGSQEIRQRGIGTEKIEEQIGQLFPEARIARMDLDTTRTRSAYERIISDFSAGKTNLLIGTQMISKGLDFDHVSVVGIMNADSMLNYPDFRAYEYAFMMMTQVSGRAGRKGRRGRVILQTQQKELPVVSHIVNNDYLSCYKEILEERKMFRYPPFFRLIYAFVRHRHESVAERAAQTLAEQLRLWFGNRVLGPDKPSVAKVKTMHIRKIVLKIENGFDLAVARRCLRQAQAALEHDKRWSTVQIYFDVDPQ